MDGLPLMNDKPEDLIWDYLSSSFEDVALVLGSLANKRRLQLLSTLLKGQRVFSDLLEVTGLGKTALAHHLGLLVRSGIVTHVNQSNLLGLIQYISDLFLA